MSNREGKVFHCTEADDRIAWEATSHSMPGDQLFPWEELPRNCSRIDVLEWYIEIANEMNLSLQNITLFPMAVDHGSLTVHTSVCNMWYSYIDRLKAESNKGKKKKRVNPILARCLLIIHCLVTNYLNDGDNVGSHASRPRKRAQKKSTVIGQPKYCHHLNRMLVPQGVFLMLSCPIGSHSKPSNIQYHSSRLQYNSRCNKV